MSRTVFLTMAMFGTTLLALPARDSGVDRIISTPTLRQSPSVAITIAGNGGAKKNLAIQDFLVTTATPDLQDAAKTIDQVLWDDIDFEGEFTMIPHDVVAKVPTAASVADLPYDKWAEYGADAVFVSTLRKTATGIELEVVLMGTRGDLARKPVFGPKIYSGCTITNPRNCAHFVSDDFYKAQGIDGIARTRLAFQSDRSDTVNARTVATPAKEIYISDYDGARQSRITAFRDLSQSPSWSPDGKSLAYASYYSGFPDIYVQSVFEVTRPTRPAAGTDLLQNNHPAFSPDGTKIAFASKRPGADNYNIYVVNRDGSNLRQLTRGGLGDVAPAWSPTGAQIVFASGRISSKPQLYLIGADGTGLEHLDCLTSECDHPSWSSAPNINKIAYTCGSSTGYDICLLDMTTRKPITLTDGLGSNEQPSFAPNGRHIVFVTTRWGKSQLAMVDLKGTISKRHITDLGDNKYPSWSRSQ